MKPVVHASPRTYVLVWITLLVMLAVSVASAYLPLDWAHAPVNLLIAATQAALVMLFSMHLRSAHPVLGVIAVIGFVGIAILIVLSLFDFMTR